MRRTNISDGNSITRFALALDQVDEDRHGDRAEAERGRGELERHRAPVRKGLTRCLRGHRARVGPYAMLQCSHLRIRRSRLDEVAEQCAVRAARCVFSIGVVDPVLGKLRRQRCRCAP